MFSTEIVTKQKKKKTKQNKKKETALLTSVIKAFAVAGLMKSTALRSVSL